MLRNGRRFPSFSVGNDAGMPANKKHLYNIYFSVGTDAGMPENTKHLYKINTMFDQL